MKSVNWLTSLGRLRKRLDGSTVERNLESYYQILAKIREYHHTFAHRTDAQLRQQARTLKSQACEERADLNELLIPAYALVCEAIQRVLKIKPFDVQIIGAQAMHEGKVIEMPTGEGKTLSAVFPAYLNALSAAGVHVLTFNDYLARRDAEWMGPVYEFLGLKVGYIREGMSIRQRQSAYAADITYLTAKEAGFDFLRDAICYRPQERVQRDFHFALIDEADSILIDEARVPLIIAGAADDQVPDTYRMASLAHTLQEGVDLDCDEYERNIHLTDSGIKRAEQLLECDNLYAPDNMELLTRLNCAIHAEFLMHRDVDYIVRNGKIELVDEFTGRVADKRRWPDGLQAALEAKEKLDIQKRGTVLNSITLQHFLKLYPRLCGMTATAEPAEEELRRFYNLDVVIIPPNKPCIRIDHPDMIFRTKAEKHNALVYEIQTVHATGRPILVGTASVRESVSLAEALQEHGVPCEVLNAKRDAHEARIVAQAGQPGAVTISTNMAGRGTDIRLGGSDEQDKQQVVALGGLYVLGANRHESLRIDQQLRGRAGRQGDPGSSRFYISLEDELFIKYRLHDLLKADNAENGNFEGLIDKLTRQEIDRLQRIIEGQNLEIKKTLHKYSAIIEEQRKIMFSQRHELQQPAAALDYFREKAPGRAREYVSRIGETRLSRLCSKILIRLIDKYWSEHLGMAADVREGIHLQRLGGKDPCLEYQRQLVEAFDSIPEQLEEESVRIFNTIEIGPKGIDDERLKAPSATWTYLANDNPFDGLLGMLQPGNIGLPVGIAFIWPVLALYAIYRWFRKRVIRSTKVS